LAGLSRLILPIPVAARKANVAEVEVEAIVELGQNPPPLQHEGLGPHRVDYRHVQHVLIEPHWGGLTGYPVAYNGRPTVEHLAKLASTAPARLLFKLVNDVVDGVEGHGRSQVALLF
jgi:hypothetical protein